MQIYNIPSEILKDVLIPKDPEITLSQSDKEMSRIASVAAYVCTEIIILLPAQLHYDGHMGTVIAIPQIICFIRGGIHAWNVSN